MMPPAEALGPHRRKLSTAEAAAYLGIGKSTLDKLRISGSGPIYSKLMRRALYDVADLDDWFAKHKRASTSASFTA